MGRNHKMSVYFTDKEKEEINAFMDWKMCDFSRWARRTLLDNLRSYGKP